MDGLNKTRSLFYVKVHVTILRVHTLTSQLSVFWVIIMSVIEVNGRLEVTNVLVEYFEWVPFGIEAWPCHGTFSPIY